MSLVRAPNLNYLKFEVRNGFDSLYSLTAKELGMGSNKLKLQFAFIVVASVVRLSGVMG